MPETTPRATEISAAKAARILPLLVPIGGGGDGMNVYTRYSTHLCGPVLLTSSYDGWRHIERWFVSNVETQKAAPA